MLQRKNITIFYHLSYKGSPRMLEWVVYPFSSRSSWPRDQTMVSWFAGGFFTNWAIREAYIYIFFSFKKFALCLVFETCCFKYIVSFLVVYRGRTKSISYIICSPQMLEGSYDFIVFSSQYIPTNVVLTYFFEYSFLVVCSMLVWKLQGILFYT